MDLASFIVLLSVLSMAGFAAFAATRRERSTNEPRTLPEAAAQLQLKELLPNLFAGEVEGTNLRIERVEHSDARGFLVEVHHPEIPPRLILKPETITAAIFGEEDISVGDAAFDARAMVQGDLLAAVSLSAEARAAFVRYPSSVTLIQSTLSALAPIDVRFLAHYSRELLKLAKLMAMREEELIARAQDVLIGASGARALALFNELRARASAKALEDLIELALMHDEVEVQVAAAPFAARDVSEMLGKIALHPGTGDGARARAIEQLRDRSRLPHVSLLARLIPYAGPEVLAVLAKLEDARAQEIEARLISLVSTALGPWRIGAIGALAGVGTSRALGALESASRGLTIPGEVKEAARRAIAAIESRRSASAGQLGFAEGDGSLSLTASDGALSCSEESGDS